MKKQLAVVALGLASLGAHAQDSGIYGLIGMGLTGGGEDLVTVEFTDGSTSDVSSGGLVHVFTGVEYRFASGFSMQANIGYHVDDVTAENGSVRFSRYPVELLAHYQVVRGLRIGGGVRKALNPKISGRFEGSSSSLEFESNVGGVVEAEYLFSRNGGVKARGVFEKYKATGSNAAPDAPQANGNHWGLYATFYF